MEMATADDFVKAILLAFSPDCSAQPELKEKALALCQNVKGSTDGYRMCLERLASPETIRGPDEVKFWCLEVVQEAITKRYTTMSEEERAFIRTGLMYFLTEGLRAVPQPGFVKNKLCYSIIKVIKHDYPHRWPSFFIDMLELIKGSNKEHVYCFLRCLKMFEEEIVEYDVARTKEEVDQNMLIKDTIRETSMPQILESLRGILKACLSHENASEELLGLALLALEVLSEYIGWNDVNLIANPDFVQLLYALMHHPHLRNLATECVSEIIYKRMAAQKKLLLIQHLNVIAILSSIDVNNEETFIVEVASLLNTVALQLFACTHRGRKVPQINSHSPEDVLSDQVDVACSELLMQVVNTGFRFLSSPSFKVQEQVLEMYGAYVSVLKQGQFTPGDRNHAAQIFVAVMKANEFPSWFNFTDHGDDEVEFLAFRTELKKLFLNLARGLGADAVSMCKDSADKLLKKMFNSSASTPEVEALLDILYMLCEAVTMKDLKSDESFWAMLIGLLTSPYFNQHNIHPQVQMGYFSLCRRYPYIFEKNPPILTIVIAIFMDKRGISNPNDTVRSQACYLIFKLISSFSKDMLANLRSLQIEVGMLQGIQNAIAPFFNVSMEGLSDGLLGINEVQYLCELMGILVSSAVTGDMCRASCEPVLSFFQEGLDSGLRTKGVWIQDQLTLEIACLRFCHVINAVSHFTKSLDINTAKSVFDLLKTVLESVLQVLSCLPTQGNVRSAVIFFLHRMSDCLKEHVLPYLSRSLEILIANSDRDTIVRALELVNQCITKYKGAVSVIMDGLFMVVVNKAASVIQSYAYVDEAKVAYSVDNVERITLFKVYYGFLKGCVEHCPEILTSERNNSHLSTVLDQVMTGCVNPEDTHVNKSCVKILNLIITYWQKNGALTNPQLQQFVLSDLTSRMFESVFASHLKPADAGAAALMKEVITLQMLILQCFNETYLNKIGERLVLIGWPHNLAQEYCVLLSKGEQRPLRQLLRRALEEKSKKS